MIIERKLETVEYLLLLCLAQRTACSLSFVAPSVAEQSRLTEQLESKSSVCKAALARDVLAMKSP